MLSFKIKVVVNINGVSLHNSEITKPTPDGKQRDPWYVFTVSNDDNNCNTVEQIL